MSVSFYYNFGGGNMPNNLAYYLESENPNSIKTLKLVLNINNGNKKPALSEFADVIGKTYKELGLTPAKQIISAAKTGKEAQNNKDIYSEHIKLEKTKIDTWKFIIETK